MPTYHTPTSQSQTEHVQPVLLVGTDGLALASGQQIDQRLWVWNPSTSLWERMTQPVIKTDTLSVSSDVSDRAARVLGVVSAASLPLPTGAATEATLAGIKTGTDKIPASPAQDRTTAIAPHATRLSDGTAFYKATTPADTQPVSGTFFQATQPVSAASLPLPAGASTEATLALIKAKTDNLDVLLSTRTKPADTQPVSGTFWQATQPVSGPLTDTQLRATAVPVSGPLTDTQLRATAVPVSLAATSYIFKGRASIFRTPGRAGTVGQKILSLHNATGSPVTVEITKVVVDLLQTVVKAITVAPPVIRLWLVTVLPTNGTALTKNKIGGTGASNAAVTVLGDASADGTGSATTLTATLPAGAILTQEFAPRFITAAGYEPMDRAEFASDSGVLVQLGPLQGVVMFLDYTLATQNPTTDMWLASLEWGEK